MEGQIRLALLSAVVAAILLSPAALAASTPLNMSAAGIIVNAGDQNYDFSGHAVSSGVVLGTVILSGTQINWNVNAKVNGLDTSGNANININLPKPAGPININVKISGEVPAAVFPLNPDFSSCTSNCNSEIPLFFYGMATIHASGGQTQVPVAIESPYWNPYGGPIGIVSLDSLTSPSLYLNVTYDHATISWHQVTVMGVMGGTFGSETVYGHYSTTTNSHEDLFTGVEQDSGKITFSGMSDAALNGQGPLSGSTTIPLAGSIDCSQDPGWLFGPGTCTLTGASSSGGFHTNSPGVQIVGTYATTWSVPSLTTTTVMSATVNQH